MDYNSRNIPILSRYRNYKNTTPTSQPKSVEISNTMTSCGGWALYELNHKVCGIDIDYVVGNSQLKLDIKNKSNNTIVFSYYISAGIPGVVAIYPEQYATVSTQFSLEKCWHANDYSGQCPPIALIPSQFVWDIFYENLLEDQIRKFVVSGFYCCYTLGETISGVCQGNECSTLTPAIQRGFI